MCDPTHYALAPAALALVPGPLPGAALSGSAVAATPTDPAGGWRCSLVVYSGGETGRQIALHPGVSTLGRSAAAGLQFDGPGIERLHAELTVDDEGATLRDLGSASGSIVRDRRAVEPLRLRDGDLLRLGSVILKFYRQRDDAVALQDPVHRLAMVDAATGLANRRCLHERLRAALRQARHTDQPLAVIRWDLDRFKAVNQRHGHPAGDRLLRETALLVSAAVCDAGTVYRLAADDFLVLLPGASLEAARVLAERIRSMVGRHRFSLPVHEDDGHRQIGHHQTLSLGVAEWSEHRLCADDLLATADLRLHQSKQQGRDRVSG